MKARAARSQEYYRTHCVATKHTEKGGKVSTAPANTGTPGADAGKGPKGWPSDISAGSGWPFRSVLWPKYPPRPAVNVQAIPAITPRNCTCLDAVELRLMSVMPIGVWLVCAGARRCGEGGLPQWTYARTEGSRGVARGPGARVALRTVRPMTWVRVRVRVSVRRRGEG